MRLYPVAVEIAGPVAIWVRPDSGACFTTYPAPTFSAAQGILDCVARWKTAYLEPQSVEICAPIQTLRYVSNYGGPLRNPQTSIKKDDPYQLYSTVLIDVIYKIHAVARESGRAPGVHNHLHAVKDLFERRLKQGKLYQTPCLGWSEFTPSYFGPLRESTKPCTDLSIEIPSMLHRVFDRPQGGRYLPEYRQDVKIKEGVLRFAK